MMMMMYFHFRIKEPILFREWVPGNCAGYVFSCVAIFSIAFGLEILKFLRSQLAKRIPKHSSLTSKDVNCCCSNFDGSWELSAESRPLNVPDTSLLLMPFTRKSLTSKFHVISSFLLFLQHFLDYSLMLVAMTYNYPLFLCLLAGHTVGFFVVGPLMSFEEREAVASCCQ